MGHCMEKLGALILAVALYSTPPPLLVSAADSTSPPPYTNHTVGGPAGWLFDSGTNSSAANYSVWAASGSFFLGDFLIFGTTLNATVVQTYNATTYGLCSADEDEGSDTFVYSGEGTELAVPLTEEGAQYYFSGDGDGIECAQGMSFEIKVLHGRGLPPSLAQPPPPPYVEPSPPPASTATPAGTTTTDQNENFYNGASGPQRGARWLVSSGLGALLLWLLV